MKLDRAIVNPITFSTVNVIVTVRNDDGSFAGRVETTCMNNQTAIMVTKQQLRQKARALYEEHSK